MLLGCGTTLTGYNYLISAVYHAPLSGFELTINSKGHVRAGADTSDTYQGIVKIEPLDNKGKKNVALAFIDNDQVSYKINSAKNQQAKWGFREALKSLNAILKKAGYVTLNENELKETIRAIGGAFGGPKGVMLNGQTEYLKVINIDLGESVK
jgi:hypothetical protein